MKPIFFHPAAESEMINAAEWYETQQTNLGKRFLTTVQEAINRLSLQPDSYPLVESNVQRCLTKTFPFGVLFRTKPYHVEIIAVMHLHRNPNYWKNRRFNQEVK